MSVAQACAEAASAIRRARSLFGQAPLTTGAAKGATAMRQAQKQQTTTTVSTMSDNSGVTRERHRGFSTKAATRLGGAATTDTSFDSHLTSADAISRGGIARLDAIAAQNRATVAAAASATSPAAQRAILAALRTHVGEAGDVLDSVRRRVGGLAGDTHALTYDIPLTPQQPLPEEPQPVTEDERRRNQSGEASREVFGRDPVATSDWSTAEVLDPHSYNPVYQGVNGEVRVVRIRPVEVSGRGAVHGGMDRKGHRHELAARRLRHRNQSRSANQLRPGEHESHHLHRL